jgi:hypothetical protein
MPHPRLGWGGARQAAAIHQTLKAFKEKVFFFKENNATRPLSTSPRTKECHIRMRIKAALRQHGAKHSLFYAAQKGMLEVVADLIKEGAEVNEKN